MPLSKQIKVVRAPWSSCWRVINYVSYTFVFTSTAFAIRESDMLKM